MIELNEEDIWLALAELFFLDIEPTEKDFDRVLNLLRDNNWSARKTEATLVKFIAPHIGVNLGFLIYPTVGEWAAFDKEWLSKKIRQSILLRKNKPNWYFFISDWWCRRILYKLGLEKLLNKLPA